jgi:hypothetical protein
MNAADEKPSHISSIMLCLLTKIINRYTCLTKTSFGHAAISAGLQRDNQHSPIVSELRTCWIFAYKPFYGQGMLQMSLFLLSAKIMRNWPGTIVLSCHAKTTKAQSLNHFQPTIIVFGEQSQADLVGVNGSLYTKVQGPCLTDVFFIVCTCARCKSIEISTIDGGKC